MGNVSHRTKRATPRERTASPEELAEDRRRYQEASEQHRPLAPRPTEPTEGNLASVLVFFAAWKTCQVCSRRVLFVNAQAKTKGDVVCSTCQEVADHLTASCRRTKEQPATFLVPAPRTSVPSLVGLYLKAIFGVRTEGRA